MAILNYDLIPNAAPVDMILIHGNLASRNWWKPMIEIAERGFKSSGQRLNGSIVAVDLRGHGKSLNPTPGRLDPNDLVEDIAQVAAETGVTGALTVGHSAGGLLAALLAVRHPKLVSKLLLIDPVGPKGLKNVPADIDAKYEMMKADRNIAAMVIGMTIHQNEPTREFFQKTIMDDSMGALSATGVSFVHSLENLDFTAELAQLRQPYTVFHGKHDWVLTEDNATDYLKLAPQGQFKSLPDNGHCLNYENPERLFLEVQAVL